MSEVLIKVDNVSKKFCLDLKTGLWYALADIFSELFGLSTLSKTRLRKKEFWAVQGVSFEVRRGECLGIIGRNGAGKSTLLKMLNGLIKPDTGRIEMRGRIGALIELGAGFNPILTGRENIFINASVLGFTNEEIKNKMDDIVKFAEIEEFLDTPVQFYSSGMKVRLGFAVAAQMEPDVLILDEVLAVGDAAFRVKCFNRLDVLMRNAAVIFVSHNMPQITRICSTILLMNKGLALRHGRELGSIVSEYYGLIEQGSPVSSQGSGKLEIQEVLVCDSDGSPQAKLQYGDAFRIMVRFTSPDNGSFRDNLHLLVTIADNEATNVAQVREPLVFDEFQDVYTATLLFDEILFNAGKYSLTTSLLIGERGELASVKRNIRSIVVENDTTGYAPVIFKPTEIKYS